MTNISVFASGHDPLLVRMPVPDSVNSLDAASLFLPQGVYSTFRTYGCATRVMGLNAHLKRLFSPASAHGIIPSATADEIRSGLRRLLVNYKNTEARIRICLSLTQNPGSIFIIAEALRLPGDGVYTSGVKVKTVLMERIDPRIKSTAFIKSSSEERMTFAHSDVFEALMVKGDSILEGLTSNFYAVKNNILITARKGVLLGVTRGIVLRLVNSIGISIEYRPLHLDELKFIDESFITSSSRGVVPVVNIDSTTIGRGRPGPMAIELKNLYEAYVLNKADVI